MALDYSKGLINYTTPSRLGHNIIIYFFEQVLLSKMKWFDSFHNLQYFPVLRSGK